MIELRNVYKRYKGTDVVKGVELMIPRGARVGLVGPNGAGKSTLMKMIATLVTPSKGEITVSGQSVTRKKKQLRRRIGYVPQEIALHTSISVKENLKFWAGMAPGNVSEAWILQLVDMVGLRDKVNERVDKLSGGMQRKLNIIVALLHNPELLIMDEPTVGIDIPSKTEIVAFLKALGPDRTILFSSHDLQEIEMLCHYVLVLEDGVLRHFSSINDLPHSQNPTQELLKQLQIIQT
ncbi:ABC transporter ATP-binding protein [Pseudalkalibacillus salsuginis]|uniref:ABC transporter ATP-binding protein n=1 Tax=Pseudalkalibacillus salsuginis TaxID=2910972 RepID=UPI001F453E5C|nr:ABC transporter ATP-binding protein [Pseudalkalibacillus salsuginis]MCF6410078.1 ABC transporter ATP-binding protein [Pseudalkalibacillus salsuginis]